MTVVLQRPQQFTLARVMAISDMKVFLICLKIGMIPSVSVKLVRFCHRHTSISSWAASSSAVSV